MFVRFWLFSFSLLILLSLIFARNWWWTAVLYGSTGFLWVSHDVTRPRLYRPYSSDRLFWRLAMIVFWPPRVFMTFKQKCRDLVRNPARFLVMLEPRHEHDRNFSNWSEAVAYARTLARDFPPRPDDSVIAGVTIVDVAMSWWDHNDKEDPWREALYRVSPSGEVHPLWGKKPFSLPVLSHKLICRISDVLS